MGKIIYYLSIEGVFYQSGPLKVELRVKIVQS